jgi:hypothetical protein
LAVAVTVADWAVLTEATVAVKDAVEAPDATVTLAGIVTDVELLARATVWPPDGVAELNETVQAVVPEPVNEAVPQDKPLTVAATAVPVPLRATVAEGALLEIVNTPVAALAVVGENWTLRTTVWPGFSVVGKLPPETENPVPEIESELIVTAAVPLEVTVTDCETAVPTVMFPNDSEVELSVRAGTAALS